MKIAEATRKKTITLTGDYDPYIIRRKWRRIYEERFFSVFAASLDFDGTLSQEEQIMAIKYLWEFGTFAITRSPAPLKAFEDEMDIVFTKYAVDSYDFNLRPLGIHNVPLKAAKAVNDKKEFTVGENAALVFVSIYAALHINWGIKQIAARFIDMIVNARMTQSTNLLLHKMPYVIPCDSEDQENWKKTVEDIFSDNPAVYVPKSMNEPKGINLTAPYIIDKMESYITRVENMFLDCIGIDNVKPMQAGQDRQNIDETNANNALINNNRLSIFETLNKCFEDAKAIFNREIRVKPRSPVIASVHEEINDKDGTLEKEEDFEQ